MKLLQNIRNYAILFQKKLGSIYSTCFGTRWGRPALAALLCLLILASVGVFALSTKYILTEKQVPVFWGPYQRTSDGVLGFLYELKHKNTGLSVYIALDTEPSENDYEIDPQWSLMKLSEEEIWNPRICARMPTAITKSGDVYMIDVRRGNAAELVKLFIHYGKTANVIREVDMGDISPQGRLLFLDERQNPFFFGQIGTVVYVYSLMSSGEAFKETLVRDVSGKETLFVNLDVQRRPVIKIYDEEALTSTRYGLADGKLVPFDGEELESFVSYIGNEYRVQGIGNDIEAKYSLHSPYETVVRHTEVPILSFKKDAKIYSYVIGSFNPRNDSL